MKKLIIAIALLNLCFTCSEPKTDEQVQKEDESTEIGLSKTEQLVEITEPVKEEVVASKLLFKASGTEPGWYAEFYNNKIKLVVDYGKDSLLINDNFEAIIKPETFAYSKAESSNGSKYALAISVLNKACIAPGSGDKCDKTVEIKLNNQTYKGCGSIVK